MVPSEAVELEAAVDQAAARARLNNIRVEFPDGHWVITSRWAVRRAR